MRNNRIRNIIIIVGVAILVVIGILVLMAKKSKKPEATYPTSTWNTGETVNMPEGTVTTFDELDPFKDFDLGEDETEPDFAAISGSDVVTLQFVPADQL